MHGERYSRTRKKNKDLSSDFQVWTVLGGMDHPVFAGESGGGKV